MSDGGKLRKKWLRKKWLWAVFALAMVLVPEYTTNPGVVLVCGLASVCAAVRLAFIMADDERQASRREFSGQRCPHCGRR